MRTIIYYLCIWEETTKIKTLCSEKTDHCLQVICDFFVRIKNCLSHIHTYAVQITNITTIISTVKDVPMFAFISS